MIVKYIRYSSVSQKADRQLISENKYDKIYIEQASGTIPFAERKEGARIIADIVNGKITTLCVEEASRIGRSTIDALSTIKLCEEYGVNLVIENLGLSSVVDGKPNPIFRLVSTIISSIAESERESIAERLDAGRVAARMRGVKFGRKEGAVENKNTFMNKPSVKEISKLLTRGGYTIREIAKLTDTSTKLVMKVKRVIMEKI
jgi:DNA invertase Pin-like site-specific DNA recombinase